MEDEVFGIHVLSGALAGGVATRMLPTSAAPPFTATAASIAGNAEGTFSAGGGPGGPGAGPNQFGGQMALFGSWSLFGFGGIPLATLPLSVRGPRARR